MKTQQSILAVLALLVAGTAGAHDGLHGPAMKYDTDRNDLLSQEEYVAYMAAIASLPEAEAIERFGKLDKNADGYVNNAELLTGV